MINIILQLNLWLLMPLLKKWKELKLARKFCYVCHYAFPVAFYHNHYIKNHLRSLSVTN